MGTMTALRKAKRELHRFIRRKHYRAMRLAVTETSRGIYSLRRFDSYRCIFVHVPKTAGVAIADSIFGEQPGHYTARYLQMVYGREYRRFFSFAFVRNPWDRIYSSYRFLRRGGWHAGEAEWAKQHLSCYSDFVDFIRRGIGRSEIAAYFHFLPQTHFVRSWDSNIGVDFVGRFESIERDFKFVVDRLGLVGVELKTRNKGPQADFRQAYDTESREIVERLYQDDIATFGYSFEV